MGKEVVYGGYRWERQTKTHLQNPKFLESYGYKVYSQNDEDGILQEIFNRIGTETKKFIEFGVQDRLECNTHYLLHKGWTGLWLEGDDSFYRQIQEKFAPVILSGALKTNCVFVTRENINAILEKWVGTKNVDFLSIDIDGNDYHVWNAISCVAPRVVCIEYNGRFSPDVEWIQPYASNHVWSGNDYFGASLKALEHLGVQKGYQLVGTNLTGVNAFFVRTDLAQEKFPEPATAENLYNAPQYTCRYITGHPNEFFLPSENSFLLGQTEGDIAFENIKANINSKNDSRETDQWNGQPTNRLEELRMNESVIYDGYYLDRQTKTSELLDELKAADTLENTSYKNNTIRISEMTDVDMLFASLENMASKTTRIVIENGMFSYGIAQAVWCFLDRYKLFLDAVYIVGPSDTTKSDAPEFSLGRIYIKLKNPISGLGQSSYSALVNAYTKSYYLNDCGGYAEFNKSHGLEVTPQLRAVYRLVEPVQGDRILDVGCGRGELTFALAKAGAQAEGIDYSADAITIAKKTFEGKSINLRYTHADIFTMNNLDTFDKIVMADVVEHIEQNILEKIFEKISTSLSLNGCLIIHTAPNKDYYEITYPQIREKARKLGCWKPRNPRSYYEQLMHINEQTPEGLETTLKRYFKYVKVWTGSVWEINDEKTPDESRLNTDIFAIACQEKNVINRRIKNNMLYEQPKQTDCHIQIEASDTTVSMSADEQLVAVTVTNLGNEIISSERRYPINLAYHILDQNGNMILFDGERTPINPEIQPGSKRNINMRLRIPLDIDFDQEYTCRIAMVAEGCFWFDQDGNNKKDISLHMAKRLDWVPSGHFYSPIPDIDSIQAFWNTHPYGYEVTALNGIDLNMESQYALCAEFAKKNLDFFWPMEKSNQRRYYINNDFFLISDAIVLFRMIQRYKPKRIIEIGSGFSSAASMDINDEICDGQINFTFIEPYPYRLYSLISPEDIKRSKILETKLQDVDLSLFKELSQGDILFIDSTHVAKFGSDVNYILFQILPCLKSGVLIHFHDIFYPFDYPKEWLIEGRSWNEAYMLHSFLQYNDKFSIKFWPSSLMHMNREKVAFLEKYTYNAPLSSLWLEKN